MTSALLDSPAARPYGPGDHSKLGGLTMSVLTKGPLPVTAPLEKVLAVERATVEK